MYPLAKLITFCICKTKGVFEDATRALTRVYGGEDSAEVQHIELAEDFDDYQSSTFT